MKKYTELELRSIIEKHFLWLAEDPNGVEANLSGADLRELDLSWYNFYGIDLRGANLYGTNLSNANLSMTDLSGAILCSANLSEASLSGAILCSANLSEASLSGAELRGADLNEINLRGANLYGADLRGANLYGADLRGANLYGAKLYGANLRGAKLYGANLYGANLRGADLSGAKLYGANLRGADLSGAKDINCPMACPEKGSFIGFKKACGDLIVELEITADALRSSATGRKCRCSKAKVISITNADGTEASTKTANSLYDPDFIYTIGEIVEASNFCTDRWNECAPGIHFFISRQEAVDFNM